MMSILRRGIKPEQKKEPAINREIQVFPVQPAISRLIPEIKDIKGVSAQKIIEIAKTAEIFDELDGKPLWKKLEDWSGKCRELAADAIDDEPYLSSRLVLLMQRQDEVVSGLRLCGKALGVEPEKQFAAVYQNLLAFNTKIPEREDLTIRRFGGKYPIDLAEREKSEKNGILYIGAGAMVHLHRAVFEMRRQTTAFITLAGDCVSAPFNAELPLGMPVKRALEFCGLSEDPTYICSSGSMTAEPIMDPENTYIKPDTKAILAFHRYDHASPAPCIGCGRCMEVCPQQLPVFYLYTASLHKQVSLLRSIGYNRCFECGACTYACPSHLDLVPVLRQGKELAAKEEKAAIPTQPEENAVAAEKGTPEKPALETAEIPAYEHEPEQPKTQEPQFIDPQSHEVPVEVEEEPTEQAETEYTKPETVVEDEPESEPEEAIEPPSSGKPETAISVEEAAEILAMRETLFGREVQKAGTDGQKEPEKETQPGPEEPDKEPELSEIAGPAQPEQVKTEEIQPETTVISEPSSQGEVLEKAEEPAPPEETPPPESKPSKSKKTSRKKAAAPKGTDTAPNPPEQEKQPELTQPAEGQNTQEPPVETQMKDQEPHELPAGEAEPAPKKPSKKKKNPAEPVPAGDTKPRKSSPQKKPLPAEEPIVPKKAATRPVAKKARTTVKRPASSKTAKDARSQSKQSQEVKES